MTVPHGDNAVLATYFADAREKLYSKGEVIIEGDSTSTDIYFIVAGYIKGYAISDEGEYHLSIIKGPTDLMPLASVFDSRENLLYYEAMTDVVLRGISETDFETALETQASLSLATLKKALGVLRDYIKRLQNLEISDARSRIIYRLIFLLERFGAESKDGRHVIFLPVTYPDLADSLNLTRDTVNRIVSQLAKEGVVSKSRSRLTITDLGKLKQEIAGY